ncbi:MAG: helix-turn-helix domain-containing protein [Bacteroidaceae bacterium]|nr:helix-turn-helix domain-containing protein [Bacteroidaceae bacterium]
MSYRSTKRILVSCLTLLLWTVSLAQPQMRHWMVADGLPTGEVQQIIELPNGQMLVNCEGVFCLSNGQGFAPLHYDRNLSRRRETYSNGYGHLWQGDSLLWLRDFYHIFLFDARSRAFSPIITDALTEDADIQAFIRGDVGAESMTDDLRDVVDSLHLSRNATVATRDRQGGIWIGSWQNGLFYLPPVSSKIQYLSRNEAFAALEQNDGTSRQWRCTANGLYLNERGRETLYDTTNVPDFPHNRMIFIHQLPDGRLLLCCDMNQLGYFNPEQRTFHSLNEKIPFINRHRFLVGIQQIDEHWTAVFSQNGAFLLDTQADSIAPFPCAEVIEHYSDKYNCWLKDRQGCLWVGTQNGLFQVKSDRVKSEKWEVQRVEGLASNCVRSLVEDSLGNVWVGTACGISEIVKNNGAKSDKYLSVENYGPDDGIPATPMSEREAGMSVDGRLIFLHFSAAVAFRPEWLQVDTTAQDIVFTGFSVNGFKSIPEDTPLSLPYNKNNIAFQFSTLNYAQPSHTHYRYRLEGLETEWQIANSGAAAEVEYRALPHGSYLFQVQARTGSGSWGPVSEMAVEILPPWWLTWWAKLGYCIIGLIGFIGLIGLYLKKKKAALERENDERVNRLFELRDAARHQFAESTAIDPEKISANVEEEELVKRMLAAINENLDNEDYGVDQLARDVAMSRSSLYDKLRTMLGISPADFIRNVRLKHAAELLVNTQLSIAEVSERVGFNSPRIFSSNFKKMFGVLPSDYRSPKE